jgi:hypothetical protein
MNERQTSSQATQIRTTIKSIVAQLDRWEQDQAILCQRRVAANIATQTEEEVSTGVHRGIVHRLFSKSRELYRLSYPRFYPGPTGTDRDVEEVLPVPLTGPDYELIAIRRAARRLSTMSPPRSGFDRARASSVMYQFYSEAFPLSFEDFEDRTFVYLNENFGENYGTSVPSQHGRTGSDSD